MSVYAFLIKSIEIIKYYSIDSKIFAIEPKPSKSNVKLGKKMACKKNFKKIYTKTYLYKNCYKVDLKSKNCSCKFFIKLGYCCHLLALKELFKTKDQFVNKPKRGRTKNADKWSSKD